jgi:putative flippase GtrA
MSEFDDAIQRWSQSAFLRFAFIGTVAFVIDTIVLYILLWIGIGHYRGRVVSYLTALTFTWYGNRRITFVSTRAHGARGIAAEWVRYLMANLTGGLVNYLMYAWLVSAFPIVRENPVLGVAAGAIAGLSVNFTLSKMLVFRGKPRETPSDG